MRALITGATGLLGSKLLEHLPRPLILTRDPQRAQQRLGQVEARAWNSTAGAPPLDAADELDVVFNLAGEPVADGRWTVAKKRRIRDSRVLGTRHLVEGLKSLVQPPKVLVSASAVGYYGDRASLELDEDSPAGSGFLADVCREWEREARAAEELGVRVVCVRLGIVLAAAGGALAPMLTAFKLGVGGRLGSGAQWMPWIHAQDAIGIFLHASRSEQLQGAVNAVSPNPITNADFTRALGRAVHRPALLPVPKLAVQLAFGEMSEIMLASQRVLPRAAERSGYVFEHRELDEALRAVLAEQRQTKS